MAPVLIPVAITALAGGAALAAGVAGVTLATVAISVASTALLAGATYLMRPNTGGAPASQAEAIAAPANAQRTIPIAQPVPNRRFVYGTVRTGGVLFFQDNDNPYLYIGVVLSDGMIDGVVACYFGDEAIPVDANGAAVEGSRFFGSFNLETTVGDDSQAASPLLLAGFPALLDSNFRQRGAARAVCRMHWGADATAHQALWGNSISPSFTTRGMLVYDPRDPYSIFEDKGTWSFSANPVLCVAHFLTNAWRIALAYDDLDWDMIAEAADVCDALVVFGVQNLPTFTLSGITEGGVEIGRQLQDMLSAFRGGITYQDGRYGIVADAAAESVCTITDDDILAIRDHAFANETRNVFNVISAIYYDQNDAGQRTTTTPYELPAAEAEGLRETAITLPFTGESHSAQIIAFRELLDGRDGRRLVLLVRDGALWLTPKKDVITIASEEAAFINGVYRVQQVDLQPQGVLLTLKGYSAAQYPDPATYLVTS